MDKAKDIFAVVMKYQFWISCTLIAIIGIGTWYVASKKLRTEMEQNAGTIRSSFSDAQNVVKSGLDASGVAFKLHPNDVTFRETNTVITNLKDSVARAWDEQYKKQVGLFVWPKDLPEEMKTQVRDLKPIEVAVPFEPGQSPPTPPEFEIDIGYLETYRAFIQSEIPKLADIIGAQWKATSRNSRDKPAIVLQPIVEWNASNQGALQGKLSNYPGSRNNTPTTLQMLYAQEDLWVIQALLKIIAATNGEAKAYYQATIKQVDHILIGSDVPGAVGSIKRVGGDGTSSAAQNNNNAAKANAFASSGNQGTVAVDPAEGRYVDRHYQPLSAQQLRGSYTSTNPDEAYLSVAKRMPVRLQLVMDQRKINKLLAACANSRLPVEVRQVRIGSREKSQGGGTTNSGGGFGGGFQDSGGGFGGSFGSSGGGGGGGGSESAMMQAASGGGGDSGGGGSGGVAVRGKKSKNPYDVPVEIYGIIYIYNPVAKATLDVEEAKPEGEADSGDTAGNDAEANQAANNS